MKRLLLVVATLMAATSAHAQVENVDSARLKTLLEEGVPVIDVRTAPEWANTGVVPGSHPLTFFDEQGRYDVGSWVEQLDAIADKSQPFALICQQGVRSEAISRFLVDQLGYKRVYNVMRGIAGWIQEGYPIVTP